ncbi:ANTAR domain-containing response regulator [Paenibacillus soyae]|uniref:ANTAR domain-containing protein n=1 Tax=Paenibacillus soyae TaxID=2969249 RepID=A0A9X2MRI8_9BACL|nr:ANTAR domain-containing protein [Paenibacillus soyae]MCR2804498.1 ANTAR domain-containing protein [Paenibacillus soyae]
MRSLLVMELLSTIERAGAEAMPNQTTNKQSPVLLLEDYGYRVLYANNGLQAEELLVSADATILHMSLDGVKVWGPRLGKLRSLPVLWWCSEAAAASSAEFCESDIPVDGLLSPSMGEWELHWSLHLASKQQAERQRWKLERRQLEDRLEERKWIDQAKGILCKLKNISEAEAYEVLRKQAMNERKRMVDVAANIVKVHQLLQDMK